LIHVITNETRLKPKIYSDRDEQVSNDNTVNNGDDVMQYLENEIKRAGPSSSIQKPDIAELREIALTGNVQIANSQQETLKTQRILQNRQQETYETDFSLQEAQRPVLETFSPLRVNGRALTDVVIGGYRMDMDKVRDVVEEILPLPPAVLPRIFVDTKLNFFHCYFQGLEILAGRQFIVKILKEDSYSESDTSQLLPGLKTLINSGHRQGDTDLNTFVKRVLASTFEVVQISLPAGKVDGLVVIANLWGFPYIEAGMTCRESDVKMWLSMSYTEYKVTWFNSFKASGIPAFAIEGVQDRYAETPKRHDNMPKSRVRIDDFEGKDPNGHNLHRKHHRGSNKHTSRRLIEVEPEMKHQPKFFQLLSDFRNSN